MLNMKFSTKKAILFLSLIITLILIIIIILEATNLCDRGTRCDDMVDSINFLTPIFMLAITVLPLSILTYKMHDEVFEYWTRFAVWGVPAVIIAHILMYVVFYRNGSPDVFEKIVVVPLFILIYGSFALISLWRIITKWRELKKRENSPTNG